MHRRASLEGSLYIGKFASHLWSQISNSEFLRPGKLSQKCSILKIDLFSKWFDLVVLHLTPLKIKLQLILGICQVNCSSISSSIFSLQIHCEQVPSGNFPILLSGVFLSLIIVFTFVLVSIHITVGKPHNAGRFSLFHCDQYCLGK